MVYLPALEGNKQREVGKRFSLDPVVERDSPLSVLLGPCA